VSDSDTPHDEILARLDHYRQFLSGEEQARLVAALEQPRLPAIRVNTLKIDEAAARDRWPLWYGWEIAPVPFCAAGWQIHAQDQRIGETLEFQHGYYYIQDAASMLPAEMFSDQESPLVLDMAAAPGGKTTHLASRFEDRGVIVANDTSNKRIAALRSNLQTWGAMGVLITNAPGERFGRWFPETFDRVLVDAPCSGDTLRITTGRRLREVSDTERANLCQRQGALLTSAFQAVRPGGEIVYSTCTMAPEEDEAILDELLRTYPGAAQIDVLDHLPVTAPGLTLAAYDPQVERAIRLWPHLYQTSGFFAARIRKLRSTANDIACDPPPARPWVQTGMRPLSRQNQAQITGSVYQNFGFDLAAEIETCKLTLWQREKSVYAIPERIVLQFGDLPNVGAGFLAGQMTGEQFVPSHELITRYEEQFVAGRVALDDEQTAIWMQGRDLRDVPEIPYAPGAVILLEDARGRFVGRGTVQRDRVRNLLPRRLTQ
jgi:16S rRNA (cytosine1407-C5)-methyltransferase